MKETEVCKISVIVPIYNIEKYVSHCIESILSQSYSNLEIILVDDGSTDNSGKICDKYSKIDLRIKVIHKENGGLVSARKAGLEVAQGDYIGFVDGDDYISHLFYETLLNEMLRSQADFVHTGYIVQKDNMNYREIPFEDLLIENDMATKINIIRNSILNSNGKMRISPSIWSKLFKKEFIKKCYNAVPNELSQGEDMICLIQALMNARKISLKKIALYYYIKREGSLTDYCKVENIAEIWKQYTEFKSILNINNIYEYLYEDLEKYYLKFTIVIMNKIKKLSIPIPMYMFDNINIIKEKKIIIYGAGAVGHDFYMQMCKYKSCEIVAWVDKNYKNYSYDFMDVQSCEYIDKYDYNLIIIAVKNSELAQNIKSELLQMGVSENKIMWKEPLTFCK